MKIQNPKTSKEITAIIAYPEGHKIPLSDGRLLYISSWEPSIHHDSAPTVRAEFVIGVQDPSKPVEIR